MTEELKLKEKIDRIITRAYKDGMPGFEFCNCGGHDFRVTVVISADRSKVRLVCPNCVGVINEFDLGEILKLEI